MHNSVIMPHEIFTDFIGQPFFNSTYQKIYPHILPSSSTVETLLLHDPDLPDRSRQTTDLVLAGPEQKLFFHAKAGR